MKRWIIIAGLVNVVIIVGNPVMVSAEIYRCVHADGVVFADYPCGENAESYASETSISVVEAPEGLDEIAKNNQAFLLKREQRKQDLLAEARERRQQEESLQRQQAAEPVRFLPVFYPRRFEQPHKRPDSDYDHEPPPPVEPREPVTGRTTILSGRQVSDRRIQARRIRSD